MSIHSWPFQLDSKFPEEFKEWSNITVTIVCLFINLFTILAVDIGSSKARAAMRIRWSSSQSDWKGVVEAISGIAGLPVCWRDRGVRMPCAELAEIPWRSVRTDN